MGQIFSWPQFCEKEMSRKKNSRSCYVIFEGYFNVLEGTEAQKEETITKLAI